MLGSNKRLLDGFSTIITLGNIPAIPLYETEVTPPPLSSGKAIDTTTMRNTAWMTTSPATLKSLGAMSATVSYASDAYIQIFQQLGVNQLITVTFPDNSTLQFYGFMDSFTPGKFTEGAQPTATINVTPTLKDTSGNETPPVYHPSSTTV